MVIFQKVAATKKDKQEFDKLFDSVRLYTSYLGNASNPIPLESVFMGIIFHKYKQILQLSTSQVNEDSLQEQLISLLNNKPEGKILFYRYSKKWHGFLYSLHKDDRLILLKMIPEICSYDECTSNVINIHDSQSPIEYLFFLLALLLQQNLINKVNGNLSNKEITLLDFMSR
jgi:hypothetical protein